MLIGCICRPSPLTRLPALPSPQGGVGAAGLALHTCAMRPSSAPGARAGGGLEQLLSRTVQPSEVGGGWRVGLLKVRRCTLFCLSKVIIFLKMSCYEAEGLEWAPSGEKEARGERRVMAAVAERGILRGAGLQGAQEHLFWVCGSRFPLRAGKRHVWEKALILVHGARLCLPSRNCCLCSEIVSWFLEGGSKFCLACWDLREQGAPDCHAALSVCDVLLVWFSVHPSFLSHFSWFGNMWWWNVDARAHLLDLKFCSISVFANFWKQYVWKKTNKKQHSTKQKFYMVEVAVEFFLTHCIAVTWVEHACKNSQLHMLLSCRKAGCRIN